MLYLGPEPVEHAAASVAAGRAAGLRPAFVTNNASRAPAVVAGHLTELGIPAEPGDVVTSGQAAVRLLVEQLPAGAAVLVIGTEALAQLAADAGLRPVRRADEDPAAVLQGLSTETGWSDLAEATVALRSGALWVAGNTDSTYPSPRGPLPGNGAFVAALALATGRSPVVAGKPEPALHRESVARVGAARPLVVGDRLDTDVLGAVRGDADSLLVLTGVADEAAARAAPRGSRPTFVASDLRGLLRAHAPVRVDGDEAVCGGARAVREGGSVRLADGGDDVERLRAACALSWALADGPG